MRIASVIVDVAARAIDRAFDYLVPSELAAVQVGCAVSVEFGHRSVVGYVTRLSDSSQLLAQEPLDLGEGQPVQDIRLKPLLGILSEPCFDEVGAQLAEWISKEYLCPLSEAIKLLTPPGGSPKMKLVDGSWTLVRPGVGPVDDRWVFPEEGAAEYEPPKSAVKQRAVLQALSCGGMRVAELSLELGAVSSTLKALEKRGVVRLESRRRIRGAMESVVIPQDALPPLTQGQRNALGAIEASLGRCRVGQAQPQGEVVVLDGITGSGKTEVYLRAIAQVLQEGKTACVLVPEISLTPQTVGRFRARFGQDVAVLHSRLSAGERYDQWTLAASGQAKVVVGTRSALFAPLPNTGLIIIDEEHDGSYKQDSQPRYNAVDVAVKLAAMRSACLVLGSATPAITTLSRGWTTVELPERPSGQKLPEVTVVDMGAEFGKGSRSMFSAELSDALHETLDAGNKAVLLLNKRGFASFMLCRECGFVPECPSCSVSLTFHEVGNHLACHHCDHSEPAPNRCPKCGSPYLRKFGAGTQRVEDELRALVGPDIPIVRMDADTTKGKGAHEELLNRFAAAERAVLLGTQMIAKGLDFADVTLVGVINADTTLKLPDYRAGERTYQLLEQVSGRAGRADKPGRVIVQTYCPEHPAVQAAAAHDRSILLDEELPARKELGYPPYKRLANILVWGKSEDGVRQVATELMLAAASASLSAGEEWAILGPAPCILSRLKGDYRWHILIKAEPGTCFSDVLAPVLARMKKREGVRISVDVDPSNLL